MIDTVMFDLDGTLLQFSQDVFIRTYFGKLIKVFAGLGLDPEKSIDATWVGTKAMVLNDGSKTNAERFWEVFTEQLDLTDTQRRSVELACDEFYTTEFDTVRSIVAPNEVSSSLVRSLRDKGYTVVLATNPLFPSCAVSTRLGWIGLTQEDFLLTTHYENSTFSKPNLKYFEEIYTKIQKAPEQCLMVGNNPVDDMSAAKTGAEVFLVTDFMENETGVDIAAFRHGTFAELEEYLMALPVL